MKKNGIVFLMCMILFPVFWANLAFAQQNQKKLLIINNLAESLSAVDLMTNQITSTESNKYGKAPNEIVVYNGRGYIANSNSHNISVINLNDYSVEKTIRLPDGSNPWSLVFVGIEKMYVTSYTYNNVYIVNVAEGIVTDSISVGVAPAELLHVGTSVYVTNTGFNLSDYTFSAGSVSIINTETDKETGRLTVPLNPQSLAVAPNKKIYVVCTGDYFSTFGQLAVLDPMGGKDSKPAVVDTINIGGSPGDIGFTSSGIGFIAAGGEWGSGTRGYVYTYNANTDSVICDSRNPLIVGNGASRIVVDYATDDVYVSCFQDDNVQKLNPVNGSVVATYPAGDGPQGMTIFRNEEFALADSSKIKLEILSGIHNHDTVSVTGFGTSLPPELQGKATFSKIAGYYKIESKAETLSAVLTVNYSEAALQGSHITEKDLILSYYSAGDNRWHSLPTSVDTVNNTASAEINHFSFWALTDKNDGIISGIGDTKNAVPVSFSLGQNYPNPFNPVTTIRFQIPQTEKVSFKIYNILGQEVKLLISEQLSEGVHEVRWDGTDNAGRKAASGIYIYRIEAGKFTAARKMIFLK